MTMWTFMEKMFMNDTMTGGIAVKRIALPSYRAEDIPAAMDEAGVGFCGICHVCWPQEYPYCPKVMFRMAHCGDALLLHYKVTEEAVRSTCSSDNEPVWNDSCVEFFFSPTPQDGTYYNLECNCTGSLLIGYGLPKRMGTRQRAGADITGSIGRWASLGGTLTGCRQERTAWEVALLVPAKAFFAHQITSFDGMEAAANFYKCGDALPRPHYLAWQAVNTPHPDFHRPECFGVLHLERHKI